MDTAANQLHARLHANVPKVRGVWHGRVDGMRVVHGEVCSRVLAMGVASATDVRIVGHADDAAVHLLGFPDFTKLLHLVAMFLGLRNRHDNY